MWKPILFASQDSVWEAYQIPSFRLCLCGLRKCTLSGHSQCVFIILTGMRTFQLHGPYLLFVRWCVLAFGNNIFHLDSVAFSC
jgi:hypothetical protein